MKTRVLIILISTMLASCTSSKKYLEKGYYHLATKKAVWKLMKNPNNPKELWVLTQAYKKANMQNTDRIDYLRKTGQPDIWEEVYQNYLQLKTRQDMVKKLPDNVLTSIGFQYINYDNDLIESERKACDYFYANGMKLLAKGDKFSARQAYEEFLKIKKHYNDFKDVNEQIINALEAGTTHVILYIKNNSNAILPQDFEYEFKQISLTDLNTKWVKYDSKEQENVKYDYTIIMNLKIIDVSPERIKEKTWIETKDVQDGWTYKLDKNGNVMKDSLGNDIKEPRYIRISCHVKEVLQNKEAILSGKLDFYNNITKQLIASEHVTANSFFNNNFVIANGDLRALTPETQKRLGNGPLPFPSDFDIIMMANEFLQNAVKNVIRNKSYLIK